jgi:hypothetical protein
MTAMSTRPSPSTLLAEGSEKEKAGILDRVVYRVIVASTELQIELNGRKLARELLDLDTAESFGTIELHEPYHLAHRGSEVGLILVNKDQRRDMPIPNLVRAVVLIAFEKYGSSR